MDSSLETPDSPGPLGQDTLAALVAQALPALRAFVRLKMGSSLRVRESSLDLVQSACAEALTEMPRLCFSSAAEFRRWLFEVASRRAIDKARFHHAARRDVDREVAIAGANASTADHRVAQCYSSICTPSQMAMGNEALERFEQAFDRLRPDDQAVILGICIQGRSAAEVGREMGRQAGAVRVLLLRARDRLRKLMEE